MKLGVGGEKKIQRDERGMLGLVMHMQQFERVLLHSPLTTRLLCVSLCVCVWCECKHKLLPVKLNPMHQVYKNLHFSPNDFDECKKL